MTGVDFKEKQVGCIELSRKAWTAYLRLIFWALFFYVVIIPIIWTHASSVAALFVVVLIALWLIYEVLLTRSHELYCDELGVWVCAGVFPWATGVSGVKWRDLDEAVYYPNLLSWLGRSYTVRLSHRFTKTNEIVLDHMANGNWAAEMINWKHRKLLRGLS